MALSSLKLHLNHLIFKDHFRSNCRYKRSTPKEFPEISPELHQEFLDRIKQEEKETGSSISIQYVSHEDLKKQTCHSKAIVRTGECTSYANAIFHSGVAF